MLPGIEALVFDFDGLLMDTESTLLESWRAEWRRHGLALDEAGFFADHGGDLSEARYAQLGAAVGPGFDRAASHARRTAHRDAMHAALGLAPGLGAWLDRAEELGLPMAVASSSPRSWVEEHLGRTGDLGRFKAGAFGDEVAAHKPDPAVYRLALERLGVAAARAVAFEDTPHGAAAARAAGLRCVAVPNAYADPARFTAAGLVLSTAAGVALDDVLARLPR
ncbi:HAD family hydrolase [Dactylosporangium sp. McL0621]|uniref:HAD family hydrolase n=1 Tax=Dactylosporangium sp. McL0621 TaxID=3415678 RepID=UPI003CEF7B1E